MDQQRRDVLKYSAVFGLMATAGLISPAQAQEWNKAAFEGKTTLKAQQMAILVDKNPSALAAQFFIPAGTEPFVTTRIKMGQTSNVYALVKADNKWSVAVKEVKVTLGGCGG